MEVLLRVKICNRVRYSISFAFICLYKAFIVEEKVRCKASNINRAWRLAIALVAKPPFEITHTHAQSAVEGNNDLEGEHSVGTARLLWGTIAAVVFASRPKRAHEALEKRRWA